MFAYRLQVQGYNLSASPLTIFFCRSGLQFFIAFSLSSFHIFITEINHVHPQYVVSTDKTSTCRGHWWTPLAVLPVNDSGITKSPTSASMGAGYLLEKPPERKLEEVRNRSSCMWENHWRYGWYRPINWRYKLSDLDSTLILGPNICNTDSDESLGWANEFGPPCWTNPQDDAVWEGVCGWSGLCSIQRPAKKIHAEGACIKIFGRLKNRMWIING